MIVVGLLRLYTEIRHTESALNVNDDASTLGLGFFVTSMICWVRRGLGLGLCGLGDREASGEWEADWLREADGLWEANGD